MVIEEVNTIYLLTENDDEYIIKIHIKVNKCILKDKIFIEKYKYNKNLIRSYY